MRKIPEPLFLQMVPGLFRTSQAKAMAQGLVGLEIFIKVTCALPGVYYHPNIAKFPSCPRPSTNMCAPFYQYSEPLKAAVFKGKPHSFYGNCALCLRLRDGDTDLGISSSCPSETDAPRAYLSSVKNSNNCKPYRFQETNCIEPVAPVKPE